MAQQTPQDRVRHYLWLNRLTQQALARQAGIDPTALSRWMKGRQDGFTNPAKFSALTRVPLTALRDGRRAA